MSKYGVFSKASYFYDQNFKVSCFLLEFGVFHLVRGAEGRSILEEKEK